MLYFVCSTPQKPTVASSYSNSYSSTGQNITEEDDTALVPVNATSTNIPTVLLIKSDHLIT